MTVINLFTPLSNNGYELADFYEINGYLELWKDPTANFMKIW